MEGTMNHPAKDQSGIQMDQVAPYPNGSTWAPSSHYGHVSPTATPAPAPPGVMVATPAVQGGWWARTKLRYKQHCKKTDPDLPAEPASLGLAAASAALAGNITGTGILGIPFAFVGIGWGAIVLLPLFGILAAFSANLLKSCCEMLEERFEEYRKFQWCTQYSDIAHKALGPGLGKAVSVLRVLCYVGLQAVLIVITADTVAVVISAFFPLPVSKGYLYCAYVTGIGLLCTLFIGPMAPYHRYWCGLFYLPLTMVLTVVLLAAIANEKYYPQMLSTGITVLYPFDFSSLVSESKVSQSPHHSSGVLFFVGLGIIAFNFAGVCGFTYIRRDMRSPTCFTKAAAIGVAGCTLALFVVGVAACAVLEVASGNVVLSLNGPKSRIVAAVFLLFNEEATFGLACLIKGEYDCVEDYGKRFACSRVKTSSPLTLCAAVLAVAVPDAGALMGLFGSAVLCPVAFKLPSVFYYKLCQGSQQWPQKPLSTRTKAFLALAFLSGLLVFLGGTVSSIIQIVEQSKWTRQSCFTDFCYEAKFKSAMQPTFFPLSMWDKPIEGLEKCPQD